MAFAPREDPAAVLLELPLVAMHEVVDRHERRFLVWHRCRFLAGEDDEVAGAPIERTDTREHAAPTAGTHRRSDRGAGRWRSQRWHTQGDRARSMRNRGGRIGRHAGSSTNAVASQPVTSRVERAHHAQAVLVRPAALGWGHQVDANVHAEHCNAALVRGSSRAGSPASR